MLGGLAVIAHGLARSTKDADIWLEPFSSEAAWAKVLESVLPAFQGARPYDLRERQVVECTEIQKVVVRDGVIRVIGLDRPLDVFRTPHNWTAKDFDGVWERAMTGISPVRVPDDIDLLVSKEHTSRAQDIADISFLENKVRSRLSGALRTCSYDEAVSMFKRYADHETCRAALQNSDPRIRAIALDVLRDMAESGDPFSAEILRGEPDNQ